MNKAINDLKAKLDLTNANAAEIEMKLEKEWHKIFDDIPAIRDAVSKLESSQDYSFDEYGDIIAWVRFDVSDYEDCQEYLKNYLQEKYSVYLDSENNTLTRSEGGAIVINEDGDVYDSDSQKFFLDHSEYRGDDGYLNEDKRNELIEEYMEKTGYFPGVFRTDKHGNIFPVNTQKTQK